MGYPGNVTAGGRVLEETGAGEGDVGAVGPGGFERLGVVVAPVGHDAGVGDELARSREARLGVDLHVDDNDVGAGGILGRPR